MTVPAEFHEVRFQTIEEMARAVEGRTIWETPDGFADVIGGIRIFPVRGPSGEITNEMAAYVSEKTA